MYTPKHFEVHDRQMILSFMREYNFALVITSENNIPKATHLPFVMEERGDDLFLISHMAKANDQWKDFDDSIKSLIIFSEPHAYISTSFYAKEDKVPTWNYVAIHAYGRPVILESDEQKKWVLEKMISTFNPADLKTYDELSEHYVNKMLKGIVAFEMKVDDLQSKFKMSQNRKEPERENIISSFEKSDDAMQKKVAEIIKKVNPKKQD